MYIAFVLDKKSRSRLLKAIPPMFPDVIAHHVTYKFGVLPSTSLPQIPKSIKIIGHAWNDKVQAIVVEINSSSRRPDNKIYHITISIDKNKGGKPVQSNNLLEKGWENINVPFMLNAKPELLK